MNIYKDYTPPAGNGGLFLKLNDGDSFRLRILGEPVVFENEYEGKLSTRYGWPVYNHDAEAQQILQGGATVYNAIAELATDDDWGDPSEYDVKVGRKGSGLNDTKYSVTPMNKSQEVPKDLEDLDLVAVISKSEFSHNVQLLSERINGAKPAAKPAKDNLPKDDEVTDEPIDLDEIPF
jgi:hypothetical protein